MTLDRIVRTLMAAALGGVALAGLAFATGTAQADKGYGTWCPGQPLPDSYTYQKSPSGSIDLTSTFVADPHWDMGVCHDWHRRWIDNGNGAATNLAVEGGIPPMNCGPGWCPVPPGTEYP